MIYLKLFLILSIFYLFFCLFLVSYKKYREGKNPLPLADRVIDNVERYIRANEIQKMKEEEEQAIEDFKSMS